MKNSKDKLLLIINCKLKQVSQVDSTESNSTAAHKHWPDPRVAILKYLTLTIPLFSQRYKMVSAACQGIMTKYGGGG